MTGIVIEDGNVEVNVSVIAAGLQITPELVQSQLREGHITSRLERGTDTDEGTYRLTFTFGRLQLQLVVDEAGRILGQATTIARSRRSPTQASAPHAT